MKTEKSALANNHLSSEIQARLVAYTTAAGLGAFFVGQQQAEGVVLESQCLGPYPNTFVKGDGTGYYYTYHYMDVDGNGTNDFLFNVDNFRINIGTLATNNFVLSPTATYYVVPWTNGAAISAAAGFSNSPNLPGSTTNNPYGNWLATDRYSSTLGDFYYAYNGYTNSAAMGFSFVDSNNLTHFGYMDVQIVDLTTTQVGRSDFSAIINGVYWETQPNTPIVVGTPPTTNIVVTGISVDATNTVTINFVSPYALAATSYVLQTSPTLGPTATWTTDPNAIITAASPAMLQATTIASGGPQQYFRIMVVGTIQ